MKCKAFFPAPILVFIVVMICYNLYHTQGLTYDQKRPFTRALNVTEEFKQWVSGKDEIILAYDDEALPFLYDNDGAYGFFVDYFDLIAKELGVTIRLEKIENGGMADAAVSDLAHGGIVISRNGFHEQENISMPIFPVNGAVCTRADCAVQSEEMFGKLKGAAVTKSTGEWYMKENNLTNYLAVDSFEEGLQKLSDEEVDYFVGNESAIRTYLLENGLSQDYKIASGSFYQANYCLWIPPHNGALYNTLNTGIYNMKEDVVIPELQGKWFGLSASLLSENATRHAGIIFIITITSILCIFYLFYVLNRGLYAELKDRTEVLLANKRELEATFNGVTDYIAEVDPDGRIVSVNKAFEQQMNINRGDVEGRPITEFLDVTTTKKEADDLETLIQKTFLEEVKKNGEFYSGRKILHVHTFPIPNSKGQTAKVLLMVMDVTKERSAERQMIQDNKMIAIGQLASGVAHEIRNPLGLIMNYCYVLKNLDNGEEQTRLDAISAIEKAVRRSGKIIDNLLNFSRLPGDRKERILLRNHIQTILSLNHNFNQKNHIQIQFICPETITLITGVDSLDMIMINLLSNAADAIEGSGTITIRCAQDERETTIEVSDTGMGIPEEIIKDIYNPFFTTKTRREGNGLGLYIVYNETLKLNGDIAVESEPGTGTTFTVTLPREEEETK